jgi:hypothetical protein
MSDAPKPLHEPTDPRLTGCADGGACVFMDRHDAEIERLRATVRDLLRFPMPYGSEGRAAQHRASAVLEDKA